MKEGTNLLILGFRRLSKINKGDFHKIRTITAYRAGNSIGMRRFAKKFGKIALENQNEMARMS